MTKRILLSVLLVLSMVIVFAPSAFAASPAVAKVGSVEYATLQEAVAAANGETVTVIADTVLPGKIIIPAGKTVTLDLNGFTVSGTSKSGEDCLIFVENTAKLTIKDSSATNGTVGLGKLTIAPGGSNIGYVVDLKGELVLESGILEMTGSWSIAFCVDVRPNSWGTPYTAATSFVMNGGRLVSSDAAVRVSSSSASSHTSVSASFTMNGGEIEAAFDGIFIQHQGDGAVTGGHDMSVEIKGGTVTSEYAPIRIYGTDPVNDIDLSIKGGTFEYTGPETTWIVENLIKGSSQDIVDEAEIAISGGTFDGDISDYCTSAAKIGNVYYNTVADAIAAAQDGDVITLLAGEIDETVSVANINKTITIKGADNFGTTLTGGIRLGVDNGVADSGKITIDGIVFSGKGISLFDFAEVYVTNNKFTNTDWAAIYVSADNVTDKVVVSDNEIDTTAGAGVRVRTPKNLTITDNVIKNTFDNSITVEHGSTYPANTGAIVITGNTLENWGTSGEGRALRLAMGSGDAEKDVTFERNVMIHTDAPEEFAKITDAPEATVSVDENYWGGMDPHDAGFVAPEVPANYYTNTSLTALAVFRAKLGDIYFVNVADAIAAADEGDIVEMLVSVPEDDFVLAVGVGLKSSAAIDAYISAPRDYVIERTYTAGGYLYTVAGTVFGVDLTPKSYTLLAGNSVQFFATVSGTTDETGVIWRLEGDHKYSYITRNGVLVASLADKTCNVTVTAISAYDTTKSASVTITIYNPFADANGRFSDVKTSAWYYDSVEYVYNEGLMLGTSETQFSPNMTVSRAMIVTILWRLEGSPVVTDDVAFPDLKDGEWYTDAAKWAAANKLVLGYDNGNFGAEDDITHEQILALFNRYADYKNLKSESASNANVYYTYSDWAKDNVIWGAANGLFDRMNSDAVSLANAANRAEIAAYLAQFCRNIIK